MLDLHAHVVLEDVLGRAGPHGPELSDDPNCPSFTVGGFTLEGVRYRGTAFMDPDLRIEAMDHLGISWQLLSPNPLTYLHHIEVDLAVDFARWHNDAMAEVVSLHPERLGGAAQLPMQDPTAASEELTRAVGELGLLAAYVGTDYGVVGHKPVLLDDPEMDVFWDTAAGLGVPVFLHPAPPGVDHPLSDARVRRFDADLWLSFAFEETLAIATIVFGGVLERHRGLDVCVTHGGGAIVALVGKLRRLAAARPWVPEHLRAPGAVDQQLARLWFDAHVSDPEVLESLARVVGWDRLVGATNFAGWDQPHELPPPEVSATLDTNARRLLRLR